MATGKIPVDFFGKKDSARKFPINKQTATPERSVFKI